MEGAIEFFVDEINGGVMPTKATEFSAGYDLYAPKDGRVPSNDQALINLYIKCTMKPGYYAKIEARSSLAVKHCISVRAGVIDADYPGYIHVLLSNSGQHYDYKKGDRIAQMIVIPHDFRPEITPEYFAENIKQFIPKDVLRSYVIELFPQLMEGELAGILSNLANKMDSTKKLSDSSDEESDSGPGKCHEEKSENSENSENSKHSEHDKTDSENDEDRKYNILNTLLGCLDPPIEVIRPKKEADKSIQTKDIESTDSEDSEDENDVPDRKDENDDLNEDSEKDEKNGLDRVEQAESNHTIDNYLPKDEDDKVIEYVSDGSEHSEHSEHLEHSDGSEHSEHSEHSDGSEHSEHSEHSKNSENSKKSTKNNEELHDASDSGESDGSDESDESDEQNVVKIPPRQNLPRRILPRRTGGFGSTGR